MRYYFRCSRFWGITCVILSLTSLSGQIVEDELVFAFRGTAKTKAERMIIVGEVVSIDKAQTLESVPTTDLNLDTRPDNVVVKVLNPKGVRVGQTLYLIEKDPNHKKFRNGNIVGQITVRSIFDTTFFGKQLRGEGFTRIIENRPMTVVRLLESSDTKEALVLKKQGDAFFFRKDIPQAMRLYRKSISLDTRLADSHYALGKIYLEEPQGIISSLSEFNMAWKYKENFSETRERIRFYEDYLALLKKTYESNEIPTAKKERNLTRMKEIAQDSRSLVGDRFLIELYSSWTEFTLFSTSGTNSQKKDSYLEKSRIHFQKASAFNNESVFLHEMAILLAGEDLGNWTQGRPITDVVQMAMERIRKHGRRLLLINPPGNPINANVMEIMERIPD